MRRRILGFTALASFLAAAIAFWYPPLVAYQAFGAMGLRAGTILGVFWLAWPDFHRLPRWSWFVVPVGLLILIFGKGYLLLLTPAFAFALGGYLLYRRVWRR